MTTVHQADDHSVVFGILGIALFVTGLFVVMALMSAVQTDESSMPLTAQMSAL
jgi:hypothetical protein